MTGLALAGIDYGPFLHTTDPVERIVAVAVGRRVLEKRQERDDALVKAIGAATGNRVGSVVAKALGEALSSIARALARR